MARTTSENFMVPTAETSAEEGANRAEAAEVGITNRYARYVLVVLVLVYVLNFIDRSILAILAEDVKADLGLSDADLGFLFGTAFTVFYATFGLALGRLADVWNRTRLISIGIGFWSLMTALSGTAQNFASLTCYRFGVGVGEASASPAIYSLLYDYFSPKVRSTVLAIYSSGLYIGAGLGLFLGGTILDAWNSSWPDASQAPFGLKGWQAAFMAVGLPGLLMSLWVATLREPERGQRDGIASANHARPFREAGMVLLSMLPIGNLWVLKNAGGGRNIIVINLLAGLIAACVAVGLIELTDSVAQWTAVGLGFYAVFSWGQSLALRDPVVFNMIFQGKALRSLLFAGGATSFSGATISFWCIPFLQRYYGASSSEIGAVLGLAGALAGFTGVILGGIFADKLRARYSHGKLYIVIGALIVANLATLLLLTSETLLLAYACLLFSSFVGPMSQAPIISTINDLVLPRGRAITSAFAIMVAALFGIALGPYLIGFVSDGIAAAGTDSGEALRQAMLWSLLIPVIGLVLLTKAIKHLDSDQANMLRRARELGEPV